MSGFEGYKKSLDEEFRTQWRETFLNHERPVAERVESSRCISGLLYQGVDGRKSAHHVFSFQGPAGKFRTGDYAIANRAAPEPRGLQVGGGVQVSIAEIEGAKIVLRAGRNDFDNNPVHLFVPGLTYVLDERLPTWAPNFQRVSYAVALAEFCVEPGDRLKRLVNGALAIEDVAPYQEPPDDLHGVRAREAFSLAIRRNLTAIQGPPGTGKTHLLARIVRELLRRELRVVFCCFTHRAINNGLRAMIEAGVSAESVGKVVGQDERDLPDGITTLDKRSYWENPRPGFLAAMTIHAAFEPFSKPLAISSKKVHTRLPQREGMDESAFWESLDRFNREVVQTARLPGPKHLADVVIFDEASQLTVPMSLCGLAIAPQAIFFGDHAQLPPVSQAARHVGVSPSVFHLVAEKYPQALARLNTSYRMNRQLCAFPSKQFYAEDLASAESASERYLEAFATEPLYQALVAPQPASMLALVDHTGHGQESPLEAALVADLALVYLLQGNIAPKEIAIIAPHRRQNNAIRVALERMGKQRGVSALTLQSFLEDVVIDTVDRIQGQERDIILYSLTASDNGVLDKERDFLFMPNRFNVAITRARKKLIVVGSKTFFHHIPHVLLHARWHGDEGAATWRMLADANLFKEWYLAHKSTAVNLTEHARALAKQLDSADSPV